MPGPAVSAAVAFPVRERRDAWHSEAQAQDVAEPFVLHVGVRRGTGTQYYSNTTVWPYRLSTVGCDPSGTTTDYLLVLIATDLCGLTAGKFDHSTEFRGVSVTFVLMAVRSVAGGRLLS